MTYLLLIRHGSNDLHENGILAGWMPDVHLNEKGQAQAQALARRLAQIEIDAVYTSPLERAAETAEIIAAPQGLTVSVRDGLGEVRFGQWTGQPVERLRRRRLWRTVQLVPSTAHFPGGESIREMQARVVAELEDLQSTHREQTIAIVAHADVIKAAVAHYVGLHLDMFQRVTVGPASLTVLELGGSVPRLVCLNDTGHLPSSAGGDEK